MNSLDKNLDELESVYTPRPEENHSDLIKRIYRTRQKKLSEYIVEDYRLMIGQKQGLEYLIPLALNILEKNPFLEGDYYEGDLLKSLLDCGCDFWKGHLKEAKMMDEVVKIAYGLIDGLDVLPKIKTTLLGLMEEYQLCYSKISNNLS